MDNDKINRVLGQLASAVGVAANGMNRAAQKTGKAISDRYDIVRVNMEIARLQAEQQELFKEIGAANFSVKESEVEGEAVGERRKHIDDLLILADQKQLQIEFAQKKLAKMTGH